MVPRDHGFGTSFTGVASYLLHDKDHANSNERVAWTYCHNLGTQDPETAFKVMAAVAMDKSRLKQQAHEAAQAELPEDERRPFRNSGRKSIDDVWHFSLSWAEDQAGQIDQAHMIEAAKDALSVLGKGGDTASEHQAIFVCHDDEPHPHVHVVVNRVNPTHGKMLSKYNDWQRFSRWAQKYEQEQGQVYCHQRVANNRLRDELATKGEELKVYGKGHLSHHLATADSVLRGAANDNDDPAAAIAEEERRRNAELAKKGRELALKQAQELQALRERYHARKLEAREQARKAGKVERAKIYAKYQPAQTDLLQYQEQQIEEFEQREEDLIGVARNIWEAVRARWNLQRAEDRPFKLSDYYKPITGEGARIEALKAELHRDQRTLEIAREQELTVINSQTKQRLDRARSNSREEYLRDRSAMVKRHNDERETLKREWAQRSVEQKHAQSLAERLRMDGPPEVRPAFKTASEGRTARQERQSSGDQGHSPAQAEHIRRARAEMAARKAREAGKSRDDRDDGHANDR